jgi:hypothetical protein
MHGTYERAVVLVVVNLDISDLSVPMGNHKHMFWQLNP